MLLHCSPYYCHMISKPIPESVLNIIQFFHYNSIFPLLHYIISPLPPPLLQRFIQHLLELVPSTTSISLFESAHVIIQLSVSKVVGRRAGGGKFRCPHEIPDPSVQRRDKHPGFTQRFVLSHYLSDISCHSCHATPPQKAIKHKIHHQGDAWGRDVMVMLDVTWSDAEATTGPWMLCYRVTPKVNSRQPTSSKQALF